MSLAFLKKLLPNKKSAAAEDTEETAKEIKEYTEQEFLSDLKRMNEQYRTTVILVGAFILCATVTAVAWKVSYGLMIALIGVIMYIAAVGQLLYRRLGLSYVSLAGSLRISEIYGKDRDSIYIPKRLLWLEVSELGERASVHASSAGVRTLYLPATLRSIREGALDGFSSLSLICFEGSEEEWSAIEGAYVPEGVEIVFGKGVTYPEKPKKEKKQKAKDRNKNKQSVADAAEEKEEK